MSAQSYARQQARRIEAADRARRTRASDLVTEYVTDPDVVKARASIWLPDGEWWLCPGITGHRSKPNHAARAVDIRACFGAVPVGVRRPRAGGTSTHATPLTYEQRTERYALQQPGRWLTGKQYKRIDKKIDRAFYRSLRSAAPVMPPGITIDDDERDDYASPVPSPGPLNHGDASRTPS